MTSVIGATTGSYMFNPQWVSPHRDLWVSSSNGEYRGMVERTSNRYTVSNERGKRVGEFDTLTLAQLAIDNGKPALRDLQEMAYLKVVIFSALVCSSIAAFALIS
ncbi:MAG: hypothetical protein JWQ43_14 [Glaciihabitans sp.]|nr:hypothetical protein [Glaciihabitans sp.]